MSQATTWSVPTAGPATPEAYATRDNASFDALLSAHRGASRPSYAVAGTIWTKDTGSSPAEDKVYFYDGAGDILIGTIDRTNDKFYLPADAVGSNFYWDNANGRLGIGTATPTMPLDVVVPSGGNDAFRCIGTGDTSFQLATTGLAIKMGVVQADGYAYMWTTAASTILIGANNGGSLIVFGSGLAIFGSGAPVNSAQLAIQSTTLGFRTAAMTTAQRTAITPDAGLYIYDTDLDAHCAYDGAAWSFAIYNANLKGALRTVPVTLTDGATITPDMSLGSAFEVTLGGNRTLANPTNMAVGQNVLIRIVQDGTGNRTLAWGSYWKFSGGSAPTLSTGAGAVDRVSGVVAAADRIEVDSNTGYA